MTTFGDLVQQVKSLLHSYTGVQEQVTWLTSACDASQTSLSVDNSDAVSMGISEIDEELIFVSVSANNTLTLAPFGRGYNGTTAAAHALNAMVTFDPVFPVAEVKRAINQTLKACYPALYAVKTTTLTFSGAQATYELPADCDKVLRVSWEAVGPSQAWLTIPSWTFDSKAGTATGKSLTILDPPLPGRTVKVVYQASFSELSLDADTVTDAGFPESAVDVLLYGTTAKLVRFLDLSRLQTTSVENLSRSQLVGANDAGKIANQLLSIYQMRLAEERRKLLENDEPQIHFTR